MNYTELKIGNETYKLRLTAKSIVLLENELGYNPIQIFMNIEDGQLPKLSAMIAILHTALLALNHGITRDDTYDIYEAFISDGHTMFDLIPVIIDVFKECGFISKDADEVKEPKN